MRKTILIPVLACIGLAACGGGNAANKAAILEYKQQGQASYTLDLNQPVPHFNFSQLRQNLKELEAAQAQGVQTTSFFFNLGNRDPIQSCPSIGAPIPVTDQLTNPNQVQKDNAAPINNGGGNSVVGQEDPTGVYSGNSAGTYVMCVAPNGSTYADYWEGFVQTVFGPATWNASTHQVQLIGPPSFRFSK